MFNKIKTALQDPEFQAIAIQTTAILIVTTTVAIALNAVAVVAKEGTEQFAKSMFNKTDSNTIEGTLVE